ncbi:PAS domain-containing protein [Sphingomonas hengshuiensis]|uniref:PAS domain-containing protein n=1 Tax=Sphingomonas hengshuiensis TaxID=1609977 RepID=UPI000698A464|nr:PAS domain-containing protein [Sphingomonas hengshuiensis]
MELPDFAAQAPLHFSVAHDVSLAGTWQCDLADESLTWSTAVFDLFGIAPGTPLDRRDVLNLYCPESRATLGRLRADAIARRGSFTFEAKIRRPDGDERWMRITADIACRNGRATHLYGLKQDITAEWRHR